MAELKSAGIRVEIDDSAETLGKRIRAGKTKKIPYLLVVGEKEEKENTVSINARDKKSKEILTLEKFTEKILKGKLRRKNKGGLGVFFSEPAFFKLLKLNPLFWFRSCKAARDRREQ